MVEVAKTVGCVVVVCPFSIQLFDSIERILPEFNFRRSGPAAFIFISRYVNSMSFQITQAIARHNDIGALALD